MTWNLRLYFPSKGRRAEDFFALQNPTASAGFEPANQHATSRPPKPRNIRSYLHRLKITGSPECLCKRGKQRLDHLIFQCNRLKNDREILKKSVLKEGNCPTSKSDLTDRNLQQFIIYINSMDFVKINHPN